MPYPDNFSTLAPTGCHPYATDPVLEPCYQEALNEVEAAENLLRRACEKLAGVEAYSLFTGHAMAARTMIEDTLCDGTGPLAERIRREAR